MDHCAVHPSELTAEDLLWISKEVDDIVSYHSPTPDQLARMKVLRETAGQLLKAIMINCPPSADRSAAIRKVREALFTANASVSLNGKSL